MQKRQNKHSRTRKPVAVHARHHKKHSYKPHFAVAVCAILIVPFLIVNAISNTGYEPYYEQWHIGDPGDIFGLGFVLLTVTLALFLIGAYIAVQPAIHRHPAEKLRRYTVNIMLASFLVFGFVLISGALAQDVYRCDIASTKSCK